MMSRQIEAFVSLAESFKGYLEKKSNANLEDFTANAGGKNFTEFGQWYGDNGVYWCAQFVSFCAAHAEIPASIIPKFESCTWAVSWFKKAGVWHPRSGSTPERGDIIFFSNDGVTAEHVGIVRGADASTVSTVEGNTSGGSTVVANGGGVAFKRYVLTYNRILGYARPAYATDAPIEQEDDDMVLMKELTHRTGMSEEDVTEGLALFLMHYDFKPAPWKNQAVQTLKGKELATSDHDPNEVVTFATLGAMESHRK